MCTLLDLPPEVLFNIQDFINLDGLKNLRSTCKHLLQSVDKYMLKTETRNRIRCVVNGYESGFRLSANPPKFPHSTLILDIPFPEEFDCFYRLDLSHYLQNLAHYVTRLECNWFLGLSSREEFSFLDAFKNLERLVFYNVCDESVFDFLIMTPPRCLLSVKKFKCSWSPVLLSLQWMQNRSFRPKSLKFLNINSDQVINFFKSINGHLNLCDESSNKLKILQIDEYCVTHEVEIPVGVLINFVENATKFRLMIVGVSSELLYKIEHVVDNHVFVQFLKCLKSVNGLHPTIRNEKMENLQVIKIRQSSGGFQDFRWTKFVSHRILPNLKIVDIGIKISAEASNLNRQVECKSARNMIEAALGNKGPRMNRLIIKVQKPEWYPLYISLNSYIQNFENLKELDLAICLNTQEVSSLFQSLQFCKVESIKLTDCHLSDECFKKGSFLRLSNLHSFSIQSEDPCSMQFFTDETFYDIFSRSSLTQLHLKGSFPLVTENGIRFIVFGERIGATIQSFRLETGQETSEIRKALELVNRLCEKNVARNFRDT